MKYRVLWQTNIAVRFSLSHQPHNSLRALLDIVLRGANTGGIGGPFNNVE